MPALTCAMQATMTTGTPPREHGIIANGLATIRSEDDQALIDASSFANYRRDVSFWEQSNQLVQQPRFWQDESGKSKYKTALLFMQNSMPGSAGVPQTAGDIVLTPKPEHGPNGKLTSLLWSDPSDLVSDLFAQLGSFPLMNYWGPLAGLASSQWIAKAAALVWTRHTPQLQWIYIPHLDYDLQRFGPTSAQATKAVLDITTALDELITTIQNDGGNLVLLSEYAIHEVQSPAIPINRILTEAGLLTTRPTPDGKLIDYHTSQAWAMADHQIAHIYTRDGQSTAAARQLLSNLNDVNVMDRRQQEDCGLNHPRSGDLVATTEKSWFDYRWWPHDQDAPTFAGTVDIHRKPGYDPLELFWDRANNRISFDTSLIRGSHGMPRPAEAIYVSDQSAPLPGAAIPATDVARLIAQAIAN